MTSQIVLKQTSTQKETTTWIVIFIVTLASLTSCCLQSDILCVSFTFQYYTIKDPTIHTVTILKASSLFPSSWFWIVKPIFSRDHNLNVYPKAYGIIPIIDSLPIV